MRPVGSPKTPGSGRAAGTKNKSTQQLQELAEKLGCDPFEILCRFAMGDWKGLGYAKEFDLKVVGNAVVEERVISPELRAGCAAKAAKYIYPELKQVEVNLNAEDGPIPLTLIPNSMLQDELDSIRTRLKTLEHDKPE